MDNTTLICVTLPLEFWYQAFDSSETVHYKLVSSLVFWAQTTTKDFIRAEGDFHKEIYT